PGIGTIPRSRGSPAPRGGIGRPPHHSGDHRPHFGFLLTGQVAEVLVGESLYRGGTDHRHLLGGTVSLPFSSGARMHRPGPGTLIDERQAERTAALAEYGVEDPIEHRELVDRGHAHGAKGVIG